jgi:hypothetical protein
MRRLETIADARGRDMSSLSVSVFAAPPDADVLDSYREAGVNRALLPLPPAGRDTIVAKLDAYAKLL